MIKNNTDVYKLIAGAGAGKTLVIILRTLNMIDCGIDPATIYMISFTNAAADELRERLVAYGEDMGIEPEETEKVRISTFNALGNDIIVKEYKRFGFAEPPRVIDGIERKATIAKILNESNAIPGLDYLNFDMDNPNAAGALTIASRAFSVIKTQKLGQYDVDALKQALPSLPSNESLQALLDLYNRYDDELRSKSLIEYADQENLLFDLLEKDPFYLDSLNIHHIVVDEYQDTSPKQNELLKKICETDAFSDPEIHTTLMAVGDDSQSIFSFRDAAPYYFLHFEEEFGVYADEDHYHEIYMTNNYRCDPKIIAFANNVNRRNLDRIEKDLIAKRPANGKDVTVTAFDSKEDTYEWIADEIDRLIREGANVDDIEVQAATRRELDEMSSKLAEHNVLCYNSCYQQMLDNDRVIGICSLRRAIAQPSVTMPIITVMNCELDGELLHTYSDDEINVKTAEYADRLCAFNLLPAKEKAEKFQAKAVELAMDDPTALDFADRLDRFSSLKDKFDYIDDFIRFGGEEVKSTAKTSGVTLSTVHSSKGLEWKYVFVITTKIYTGTHDDERERLLYVAATRARDELYVTGTKTIRARGTVRVNTMLYESFLDAGYSIEDARKLMEPKPKAKKAPKKKAAAKAKKSTKRSKKESEDDS